MFLFCLFTASNKTHLLRAEFVTHVFGARKTIVEYLSVINSAVTGHDVCQSVYDEQDIYVVFRATISVCFFNSIIFGPVAFRRKRVFANDETWSRSSLHLSATTIDSRANNVRIERTRNRVPFRRVRLIRYAIRTVVRDSAPT